LGSRRVALRAERTNELYAVVRSPPRRRDALLAFESLPAASIWAKSEACGYSHFTLQHGLQLTKGVIIVGGRIRDDAVGRREDFVFPHVRIVGREEYADVAGDAGENDAPDV